MIHDWKTMGLKIPEIMIPAEGTDYSRWAVIACDQYTSEPEYWEEVEEIVGDAPSTLRLMLPEIFLDSPDESERIRSIRQTMYQYLTDGTLRTLPAGGMLVRRSVEGHERLGLVIATDLERYDFHRGSHSLTRATEGTVLERIPPRLRIREGAPIELPHILILIDDPERTVIEPLKDVPQQVIYDTDLMMDGGHIRGSFIEEKDLEGARAALSVLYDRGEELFGYRDAFLQAVGDGNHSLATAKTSWEHLKKELTPEEAAVHPARFALCEIENIHDEGILFEPIHRVLFGEHGETGEELVRETVELLDQQNGRAYIAEADAPVPEGAYVIPYIAGGRRGRIIIEEPVSRIEVGALQNALDILVEKRHDASIDYIHGDHTVENLASEPGTAGFFLPAMDKSRLFPAIAADGALPRKTFSMGEANEKRYYIESRYIGAPRTEEA